MQNSGQFRSVPDKNAKLKQEAVAFYAQHDVTGALETLLNRMFLDRPDDVYGYMVSALKKTTINDTRNANVQILNLECT